MKEDTINILYEDKDSLVIDKPSGIAVHPDGRSSEYTITDWVLEKYPQIQGVGEPIGEIERPGVVHRLDKDTSGALLLAKNQEAHQFFKQQFQNREVHKIYNCIVFGWVKDERGFIDKPIGRSPKDFRRKLAGRGARGELREAITRYKVIKRFKDTKDTKWTYVEVEPKTGRTHQIRVHMKYLNHPVAGDTLYGSPATSLDGLNRLALHARSIEFKNMAGEKIKVESPLPKEFEKYS